MSSDNSVMGVSSTETFEGATPAEALAAARAKHGDGAVVSEPKAQTSGGVGGFFAKQRYTVTVDLNPAAAEPDDAVADAEALLGVVAPAAPTQVTYTPATVAQTQAQIAPVPVPAPAPASPFAQALAAVETDSTVTAAVQRAIPTPAPAPAPVSAAPVQGASTASLVDPTAMAGQVFVPAPDGTMPAPQVPVEVPSGSGSFEFPTIEQTPAATAPALPQWLADSLTGIDPQHLGESFQAELAAKGEVAAVTALFATHYRHPGVPVLDTGEVITVIGIGADAVNAARTIAESVGVNPASVFAAGSSAAVAQVPANRRIRNTADAKALVAKAHKAPLVVAVDTGWGAPDDNLSQVLLALSPVECWAVVDATRRTADLTRWVAAQDRVDGLIVENGEHTTAATETLTLGHAVVYLDGRPATPKRWAAVITAGAGR